MKDLNGLRMNASRDMTGCMLSNVIMIILIIIDVETLLIITIVCHHSFTHTNCYNNYLY